MLGRIKGRRAQGNNEKIEKLDEKDFWVRRMELAQAFYSKKYRSPKNNNNRLIVSIVLSTLLFVLWVRSMLQLSHLLVLFNSQLFFFVGKSF